MITAGHFKPHKYTARRMHGVTAIYCSLVNSDATDITPMSAAS